MTTPVGPQFGVKYTLVGPDGTTCVFNDTADANYVGALTDQSGLDSPEIRESADNLVQADGGIHGPFFAGRRPLTLTGLIFGHATATDRNIRATRLRQAILRSLRADSTLSWTPAGGEQQFITARVQQPLRITGAWNKEFQIALVAADPRIYSSALYTSTGPAGTPVTCTNNGSVTSWPTLAINGPGVNPTITNQTVNQPLVLTTTLGRLDQLFIDTLNRRILLYTYTNILSGSGDFETNTTGWSEYHASGASAAATWARQNGWADTGSWSLRVTSSGTVPNTGQLGLQGGHYPVVGNHTYRLAATANGLVGAAGTYGFIVNWFDSGGTFISQVTTPGVAWSGTGVYRLNESVVAPANATQADLYFSFRANTTTAVDYYVDNLIMADTAVTSVSRYSTLDVINSTWWGLQPGANLVNLTFASGTQGPSSLEVDWRNAWF